MQVEENFSWVIKEVLESSSTFRTHPSNISTLFRRCFKVDMTTQHRTISNQR